MSDIEHPKYFKPDPDNPDSKYRTRDAAAQKKSRGRKAVFFYDDLLLSKEMFDKFRNALDEQEVRLYIKGKKNLYFNPTDIASIILPDRFVMKASMRKDRVVELGDILNAVQQNKLDKDTFKIDD